MDWTANKSVGLRIFCRLIQLDPTTCEIPPEHDVRLSRLGWLDLRSRPIFAEHRTELIGDLAKG